MLSMWNKEVLVTYQSYAEHFDKLYQELLKMNEKNVETKFITECNPFPTLFNDIIHLDVADFSSN